MEEIKLNSIKRELKKKDCEGYKTDLNLNDSFSPGWTSVNIHASKIKFRYYKGKDGFEWSDWFLIIK